MNRALPKPNEIWKHFKGDLYQIRGVAQHTETNEALVIYHCIQTEDDSKLGIAYARPATMFLSEVDKTKYPEVTARYRFERVSETPELLEEPLLKIILNEEDASRATVQSYQALEAAIRERQPLILTNQPSAFSLLNVAKGYRVVASNGKEEVCLNDLLVKGAVRSSQNTAHLLLSGCFGLVEPILY